MTPDTTTSAKASLAMLLILPVWGASMAPAIVEAARNDDGRAVGAIIAQHGDVNVRSGDGTTALAWAAMRTNLETARALLKAGANPNLPNVSGVTPLSLAILNGSDPMVQLLLDNGADPNVCKESGESPLMTATRLGRVDTMKALLDHGADVNARENKFQQTALMWAAGHPAAVRLLLDRKADIRATTKSWDIKARKYGNGFNTLGKTGIPWVTQGEYDTKVGGYNALLFAVQRRDLQSAQMLVDAGLDVNQPAADGTTPLLLSLYKFQTSNGGLDVDLPMATYLLDHGAKANVADLAGYTPLHGAVLAAAAAASTPNSFGAPVNRGGGRINPNPIAARAAANVIGRRGGRGGPVLADGPPLTELLAMTRRLLDDPAPPGSSAFHVAATSSSMELLRMLEDHGANPNVVSQEGHTPFTVAVKSGNLDAVREMVAHGADLSARYNPADMIADPVESIARPRKDQTVMHVAVVAGQAPILQYLYSQNVPLDLKNEANETPLMLADAIERYQLAQAKQNGRDAVRSTTLTDAITKLLAK